MTQGSVNTPIRQDPDVPARDDIERKPWKFVGYRGYAAFSLSDDDFTVLRRFDNLNFRIALRLQDRVSKLEDELCELESQHSKPSAKDHNNGSLRNDTCQDRASLLDEIEEALKRYNDFLLQQTQLRKLSHASRHDIRSIKTWHMNHGYRAIDEAEQSYLDNEDDIVCVSPRNKNPIRRLVDSSPILRGLPVWREERKTARSYDTRSVVYYSDSRMDAFSSSFICVLAMVLLVAPIWVLQSIEIARTKLAIITTSILAFLLVVSLGIDTRPFEAFGATAAYAAVLMVFLDLDPK